MESPANVRAFLYQVAEGPSDAIGRLLSKALYRGELLHRDLVRYGFCPIHRLGATAHLAFRSYLQMMEPDPHPVGVTSRRNETVSGGTAKRAGCCECGDGISRGAGQSSGRTARLDARAVLFVLN
jgi:hypothetical protein